MFEGEGRREGKKGERVSFSNHPISSPPLKQNCHKNKSIFSGYKNTTSSDILAVGVTASLSGLSVVWN